MESPGNESCTYVANFNCTPNSEVRGNVFNDSKFGFYEAPALVIGNADYNIDTLQTGGC